MYTCSLLSAQSTPQVHNCISSMTGVTSWPGTLPPGNTGGIEETICGRYFCRQPLVNDLSFYLRYLASYEVSGDSIVCFVIIEFFLRVSNTS